MNQEGNCMTYTFRADVHQEDDGRWSAWIDSLPGCATWGYSEGEAVEALKEAAALFVNSLISRGKPIPDDYAGVLELKVSTAA